MTKNDRNDEFVASIPDGFGKYVEAAVTRLRYLYPKPAFEVKDGELRVLDCTHAERQAISQELVYLLYREKIFETTLPLRQALSKRLFG